MLNLDNQKENNFDQRINLLHEESSSKQRKVFRTSKFIFYLGLVIFLAFIVFSYQVIFTDNSVGQIFGGDFNIFKQLKTLAGSNDDLRGQKEDRINILLLGMGGVGHEGPYLTDTLILLSFKPSTAQVAMLSIPRDLYVDIPGNGFWKINNANHFGEKQSPGNGGLLVKETVQRNLNLPIHYYVRIDFAGFEKLIDELDGVKVEVENSFIDYQYPTDDYKYQVISFQKGWQTMDGETALKFARSRHGNNGEGSDFARSKRQQKIISAVKKRVFSYSFFLSPRKISGFMKELSNHLRTDFELWEIIKFAELTKNINLDKIINQVIDDSPNGYLTAGNINGAYVLMPKGNDWTAIRNLTTTLFEQQTAPPKNRTINIELRNGTEKSGLASRNQEELKQLNFRVLKIGNAPEQNYTKSLIFKITDDEFPEEEKLLEKKYGTSIKIKNIPEWIYLESGPEIDYLIILGQDEADKFNS